MVGQEARGGGRHCHGVEARVGVPHVDDVAAIGRHNRDVWHVVFIFKLSFACQIWLTVASLQSAELVSAVVSLVLSLVSLVVSVVPPQSSS